MKLSCTLGAFALLSLAACGAEREVEEPIAAEEGIGEREGLAPVAGEGKLGAEGLAPVAGEGVVGEVGEGERLATEEREREAMIGAERLEGE